MRNKLIPALLVAALGMGTAAFAADRVVGTITAINSSDQTITLSDGATYHLPGDFKLSTLKLGEKVAVVWQKEGDMNQAVTIDAQS